MKTVIVPRDFGECLHPDPPRGEAVLISHGMHDVERRAIATMASSGIQVQFAEAPITPNIAKNEHVVLAKKQTAQEELSELSEIPGIRIPQTLSYDEYMSTPFFPVMLKLHDMAGRGKYLIENQSQLQKVKQFFEDGPRVFGERIGPFSDWKDEFVFQEFIETPGDRYTSIRVIVDSLGNILASGLLCSTTKKSEPKIIQSSHPLTEGDFQRGMTSSPAHPCVLLEHPSSSVFLRSRDCRSNLKRGGFGVVLDRNSYSKAPSEHDAEVLLEHGLDPQNPKLPLELRKLSIEIGKRIVRKKALFGGIDYIPSKNGGYYVAEMNPVCGLQVYADAKMHGNTDPVSAYENAMNECIRNLIPEF